MADIIKKIFEIQDIGKGVITTLTEDNLLKITDREQGVNGLQAVLEISSILNLSNLITVEQELEILSGIGGQVNGITIKDETLASSVIPIVEVGKNLGNTGQIGSIAFYPNRIVITDALNSKGVEYPADYSANFTLNSLITKKYVDDRTTGAETKVNAGTNVTITGLGTTASPYVISSTATGVISQLSSGVTTIVSGNGNSGTPYVVETVNLQKAINADYTLTAGDNNYSIKINNGATPITITVPTGLPSNFFAGFTQKGTGDVTFLGSSTTITNPVGLKIKGEGYHVGLEQTGTSGNFDLLGFTKA